MCRLVALRKVDFHAPGTRSVFPTQHTTQASLVRHSLRGERWEPIARPDLKKAVPTAVGLEQTNLPMRRNLLLLLGSAARNNNLKNNNPVRNSSPKTHPDPIPRMDVKCAMAANEVRRITGRIWERFH